MLDAFSEKRRNLLELLDKLAGVARSVGTPHASIQIQKRVVEKLQDNLFRLVVVGEFNHGKTTFVNALLGGPVLPVGVTPTTAVIHEIRYSDTPQASVAYESGERRDLRFDEVCRFAIDGVEGAPKPDAVRALEIGFPAELLKHQITLVDTPGVNDLSFARAEITYDYIPRSDAVLFLLDAGQLIKESERVFLKEKLLGQSRDKIVFVVTKKDILDQSELKQAMQYVHVQLSKLVDNPRVFSVSADRCLKCGTAESGIDALLEYLAEFLSEDRGRIILDNAVGDGLGFCELLEKGIDAKRRALNMDVEEISRRIDAIEEDLAGQVITTERRRETIREETSSIKTWAKRDLDRFINDVCDQIPSIVDNAEISELQTQLSAHLERTFREWATRETTEISVELERLAERTIALMHEDARHAGRRLAAKMGDDLVSPSVEINSFGYSVGIAAIAGVGMTVMFSNLLMGSVLLLAAPLFAIYARGQIRTITRNKAKEAAPKALREAADRVRPKIDEMIDAFAKELDSWVATAGQEVHREVLDALMSARKERERGEAARALSISDCQKHHTHLHILREELGKLRHELRDKTSIEQGNERHNKHENRASTGNTRD